MSGAFATRWDFLLATVLVGVDRTTGVFSGSESTPGQQMVAVWTSEDVATDALHVESWELRPIAVRDLLAVVPAGVGIVVDPERTTGMTASPAYVANLKQLAAPFPAGTAVRLGTWDRLPGPVLSAVSQALSGHEDVSELHAFTYTIDDSPSIGCLAYAGPDGSVAGSIEAAVSASADPADLGVGTVNVLRVGDLPEEVRAVLGDRFVVHRARRPRRWRR